MGEERLPDGRQNTAVARGDGGRWLPGQSPNPGGRPKTAFAVRELARERTERALQALDDALEATKLIGLAGIEVPDHDVRIKAATALLERGYGKPVQEVTGIDGAPLFGGAKTLSDEELVAKAAEIIQQRTGVQAAEA